MFLIAALAVHFVALGDSLAYGTGASAPANSFASRLYAHVAHRFPRSTYANVGAPGATISDVARTQVARIPSDANVVVLVAGANDVAKTSDPYAFARRYGRLLDAIAQRAPGAHLIVAGMPNVANALGTPAFARPVLTTACTTLDVAMRREASSRGASFFDLYGLTSDARLRDRRYFSHDGIHPSDLGYAAMANAALPLLDSVLDEQASRTHD